MTKLGRKLLRGLLLSTTGMFTLSMWNSVVFLPASRKRGGTNGLITNIEGGGYAAKY